eukprot:CAMPEP_0183485028 /NCGR_PEP_ID=MMETSP0370-20130417/179219_1 /TAXON_ID=268820 /ORGANISM="Peridinium aciculiferum, Strain PAER-2" /LENGTH=352 /DNA_ID=CAMNT_0025678325 /DNA_START=793 /DNA_END=1852 /DNA_ORIENTATION=-
MALASTGKASDAMHGLLSAAVCACPKLVLAVAAADGASNARPELWHAALGAAPRDQVVAAFLATRALHARDALLGLMRAAHGAGPRLAFVVATTNGACAAGPLIGHAALRAVHVMPSPLQEPSIPATHCIGSSRQQYVPVQRCPFNAQASAQPATHWEPLGTQHWVPVQCMPLALQLLSKPGTQVAGLLTQHLSPVQKLPPASHALWCPPEHVQSSGTLQTLFLPSHETPLMQHLSPVQKLPPASHALWCPPEHVQSSGTLQTLFLPSHETPLMVSPQVPQKFQEPGTSCEPALDVLFRAWLCRSILVASIETQSPPSAEQASSLAEPKRPIATAATPNTSEIFTMATKQED